MSLATELENIPTSDDFPLQVRYFLRVHKDGRCERFLGTQKVLAGIDPSTGVQSKDVVISQETKISVRIYIPKFATTDHKLPIMIYFHGGGFIVDSAMSPNYHPTLNLLTKEANVISVSDDYRLAPEHPVPICYNDSWEALRFIASHSKGNGPDPWLNKYANFEKVFLAGDSAGVNIAHNMAIRSGSDPIAGINLKGLILLHPYFGGKDPIGSEREKLKEMKAYTDEFWNLANSSKSGLDDPLFNPEKDPNLSRLGCTDILIWVAQYDSSRDRGFHYKELMEKSEWPGKLEIMESKEETHVFFLFDTSCENACTLRSKISTFINHNPVVNCLE